MGSEFLCYVRPYDKDHSCVGFTSCWCFDKWKKAVCFHTVKFANQCGGKAYMLLKHLIGDKKRCGCSEDNGIIYEIIIHNRDVEMYQNMLKSIDMVK